MTNTISSVVWELWSMFRLSANDACVFCDLKTLSSICRTKDSKLMLTTKKLSARWTLKLIKIQSCHLNFIETFTMKYQMMKYFEFILEVSMIYPTHSCGACCRRNQRLHVSHPPPCPASALHSVHTNAKLYNKIHICKNGELCLLGRTAGNFLA